MAGQPEHQTESYMGEPAETRELNPQEEQYFRGLLDQDSTMVGQQDPCCWRTILAKSLCARQMRKHC